jgi:RNase P/RNase MRP subunit p29
MFIKLNIIAENNNTEIVYVNKNHVTTITQCENMILVKLQSGEVLHVRGENLLILLDRFK